MRNFVAEIGQTSHLNPISEKRERETIRKESLTHTPPHQGEARAERRIPNK